MVTKLPSRVYHGLAGTIQNQVFIGILFTLDAIVFFTMAGVFVFAGWLDNGIQIFVFAGLLAYLAAIVGYYLTLHTMLKKPLQSIEQVEKSMQALTRPGTSKQDLKPVAETADSISLVRTYNLLVKRLKEAEANQVKFLALATHELRSPVASMVGYAELMADGTYQIDRKIIAAYAQAIETQGRQTLRLIDNILTTAKMDADLQTILAEPLPFTALLEEIVQEAREGSLRPVEFHNLAGEVSLCGDALRLREVFVNLIDNALKYSPTEAPVSVSLKPGESAGWIEVSVTDQGIGIDERELPKLFTYFGRIETGKTSGIPGTGLGLYIAKTIVQRHNGRIMVESVPGKGSTFTVSLPLNRPLQNTSLRRESQ